eukprot:1161602-Pelagomonas_calceolata.AAC.5
MWVTSEENIASDTKILAKPDLHRLKASCECITSAALLRALLWAFCVAVAEREPCKLTTMAHRILGFNQEGQRHAIPPSTRLRGPAPRCTSKACTATHLNPLAVHSTPWFKLALQKSLQLKLRNPAIHQQAGIIRRSNWIS